MFFNEILRFFYRYIQNPVHIILSRCVEIWHFYPVLSVIDCFSGHSVVYYCDQIN